MKKLLIKTFPIVLLFSSAVTTVQAEPTTISADAAFKNIADLHLASLPAPLVKEKKAKSENEKTWIEKLRQIDNPVFEIDQTSKYEAVTLGYSLLSGYLSSLPESGLNNNGYKDLEIFCGSNKKDINLLQIINRTHLAESEVFLANLLARPTSDVQELQNRQAIIKVLLSDTDKLENALNELKEHHNAIASFWGTDFASTQTFVDRNFWQLSWLKPLNSSSVYQHAGTTLALLSRAVPLTAITAGLGYLYYNMFKNRHEIMEAKQMVELQYPDFPIKTYIGIAAAYNAMIVLGGYLYYDDLKNIIDTLKYLHEKTLGMARIVKAVKAIHEIIEAHPELQNLSHAQTIKQFALVEPSLSQKVQDLINVLDTNTFKGEKPSAFALHGRSRLAYALIQEIKNELAPAFTAIAEVDAYLSCAKLYKEFEGKENSFAFATYIENSETPHVLLYNMWNPFVGSEKSVVNSVELGGTMPTNMILTGPNAGGKSTFSKGITLSLVLGQTIGLVPAKAAAFTPFAKINTYMNIADDTAGGNSLFKSEVMRAQQLLDTINKLDKNQFSFSVMDEVFSGTSPKEGEAASCAVAKNLASKTNSIAIIATHFQKMKELEETNKAFKNYQVRVVRHADGTFSYPFKLQYGAADQNVAIEMLKNEGFENSIVQDALGILQETATA